MLWVELLCRFFGMGGRLFEEHFTKASWLEAFLKCDGGGRIISGHHSFPKTRLL